jgi:hypothetical protein
MCLRGLEVINCSHTFYSRHSPNFAYSCLMNTLKMCRNFLEVYGHVFFFNCSWTYKSFFQLVLIRYLFCFKQFYKLFTVVMDTLEMCMWLFGSVQTFSKRFTCSWTLSFFQHVLTRLNLLCVINSSHTFMFTFSNFAQLLWTHWRCACDFLKVSDVFHKIYM